MFWFHSMAKSTWIKVKSWWQILPQYQSTYPKRLRICINWNPPFQTKLYLLKVPLNVNILKQDLLNKKGFLKILWSEVWRGISIDAGSGPLRYLLCCGIIICHQLFTFIQIGSGHTVTWVFYIWQYFGWLFSNIRNLSVNYHVRLLKS